MTRRLERTWLAGSALIVAAMAVAIVLFVRFMPPTPYGFTAGEVPEPEPPTAVGVLQPMKAADGSSAYAVYAAPGKRRLMVYLHGMCANPQQDLRAFSNAAIGHGHMVAPVAPLPCPNGNTQWGGDIEQIEAQISAAIDAASAGRRWDRSDIILIGYSQGAHRGEQLAARFGHYRRVILIGSPRAPEAESFPHAIAASFLAGEIDRQDLMKAGEKSLTAAGKPAQFLELPGAQHGQFGPEGQRVMDEAIRFVLDPSRG